MSEKLSQSERDAELPDLLAAGWAFKDISSNCRLVRRPIKGKGMPEAKAVLGCRLHASASALHSNYSSIE